ncbi:MAG TPA: YceI family protein [Phenylobacterium sp.]|uniref:YceI family protein n=1 Tax=Phenylobacterium sp. TaxID=1871053 RepID=UPI002B4933B1|nr:YceI family protein [Phenylobacterium sp.]HKR86578.1 YceI family protein [Phenylobacterium sp.]
MPDVLPIALVLALLAPVPGAAQAAEEPRQATAGDYVLDSSTASLVIRLTGFIGSTTTLRLTKLEGRLHYDPARPEAASVTVSADPRSIQTSHTPVARYAKTLFEPQKFPIIAFTSTTLTWDGASGDATGDLTFHGVTRPTTLNVSLADARRGASPTEERVRFLGRGQLKRSAFGLTQGRPFVGDTVSLSFDLEFVKPPTRSAQR